MSNPSDPKKPTPEQPDPNAQPPQPDDASGGYQSGSPSFEFQLPDEVGSYSELPPIPEPDANDTSGTDFALPPKPEAGRPGVSFDFISLPGSRGSFGDFGMEPLPLPTEDALALPDLPAVPGPGDSAILLDPPALADPATAMFGMAPLTPASLPDISTLYPPLEPAPGILPELPPQDAMADIDLGSESGILLSDDVAAVPVAGDSAVGFAEPLPDAEPVSAVLSVEPAAPDSAPDLGGVPAMPVAGDSSIALDEVEEFAVAEPASSFVMGSDKPASSPSVPDLASLFPAPASSGSTPELPTTAVAAGSSGSTPELPAHQRGGSSFEFQLPDEVGSYSELPPIPDPDANDTSGTHGALPPKPVARPADASFDFINATGSRSFADIDFAGQVIEAEAVPTAELPAADSGIDLGDEAVDAVVVAPASGWLDSAVVAAPIPVAGPSSDPFDDAPAADLIESSDIFSSGPGGTTAELVDGSGVLPPDRPRPTAERAAEPVRPSEVALTFNDPPGGSTVQDGDLSDLPVADEFADSGTMMLSSPAGDDESIHDQLALTSDNPLFDSATLADSPDLPADPDAAEFGVASDNTSDASSILADLTEPYEADGDSSSVRVEAPGLDRTLTGGPSDASFDLTVSDEPIPAELFDEADDGTLTEATAWQEPSGSGLLGQGQTAAKIDLSDVIEVEDADLADADLFGDLPETSSPPSSIFSGSGPPALSPSARIGGGQPADEMTEDIADAVEFTDRPELEETVTRDLLPPAAPRKRVPNLSSADFELSDAPAPVAAEVDDEGAIDWDAVPDDEDQATRGNPKDASLSAILRGELPDDSDEMSTKNTRPLVPVRYDAESTAEPQVSVDWLAGSAEGSAVEDAVEETEERPVAKGKAKAKKDPSEPKTKAKTDPNRDDQTGTGTRTGTRTGTATAERKTQPAKKGGVVIGLLVGAVVAGGAFAGVYFGGVLPNGDNKGTAKAPTPGPDGKVTIDGKDYVPAKGEAPANPLAAFAAGDTAKALDHFKTNPPKTATDMAASGQIRVFATVQALKDGESVKADDADLKTAREELREVIKPANTAEPGGVKRGVKATVALGVSHEIVGEIDAARKVYQDGKANYPTYASTFEALIDKLDALAPPAEPPPGTSRRLDPADAERILFAVVLLLQGEANPVEDPEPGVHYWKAVNLAAGGKYKEAVEQITEAKKAHAVRARVVAGRGLNPLSDPLEQIFTRSCDELKAYWELRATLYGKPGLVAAIKRDGDLAKALDTLLKAEKDVVDATAMAKKLETDVTNLKKDVTDVTALKKEAEDKLKVTEKNLETTTASLKESERDAKDQGVALAAIVESLKPVAPVPEKWTGADVVRATKAAVARASGPDLRKLVPDAMMAVGGGGLTTGMLLDISDRLTKAEAAAKDATAKLAAETKRLTDKYDTDTKALKDGSAEEIKKLDTKHAVALKDEQTRTDAEKKRAATREIEVQKQLANTVSPGQVMDIWLPTLTDLRRPSDSAAALAAAEKALAGSTTDSEDAAKAKTVAGMAYLLKGDLANAKESFQVARRSPAYAKAPPNTFWARVADEGLEAVADPIAPYRQPVVVPPVDLKAAAAGLDAGIAAYKTGRYAAAVKALEGAVKNNPADPVAWYFLGATRWAQGDEEQAKKDFAQGAEREKVSVVPNRTLSAALAPIQGATRDVIDRTRP